MSTISHVQRGKASLPHPTGREIRLANRPHGTPTTTDFTMVDTAMESVQENQVRVRNLYMSVDPYMRGRMNEGTSYVPPFEVGKALEGGAVGEIIESRVKDLACGDVVVSNFGWREQFIAGPNSLRRINRDRQPLSVYLGALGMTGMTAWAGLKMVEIKAGDVLYVSGAAGAVGCMVGQLAKIRGCRVIGSAGSDEKVTFLKEHCGCDLAFNYKAGPVLEQLNSLVPDGIDVYFDNVGGESLEAALSALRVNGRIIACGGISGYNEATPRPGPANLFNVTTKRLTMKGLIVSDWLSRQDKFEMEVGSYLTSGAVKSHETVVEGIDKAVSAFIGLFQGKNLGKMVVRLTPSS